MKEIDAIRSHVDHLYHRHDGGGHKSGREACRLILQQLKSDEIDVAGIRVYVQDLHGYSDFPGTETALDVCSGVLRFIDEKGWIEGVDKEKQKRKARDAAFVAQAGTNWCRTILTQMLERHGEHMHTATREYIRQAEEKLHQANDFAMDCIDTE